MQANYGSILGQYGEKAKLIVRKLFESDMIHFLGSDVHRQKTIYPKIPRILEELKQLIDIHIQNQDDILVVGLRKFVCYSRCTWT